MSDTSEDLDRPPKVVPEESDIESTAYQEDLANMHLNDADLHIGLSSELSFCSTVHHNEEVDKHTSQSYEMSLTDLTHELKATSQTGLTPCLSVEATSDLDLTDRNSPDCRPRERRQTKTRLEQVKTASGFFFVTEFLASFLTWVLLVAWSYASTSYRMPCPLGFSLFVAVSSWIFTGILFITLLFEIDLKFFKSGILRRPKFGMCYNCFWACLYLIGGAIVGSKAVYDLTQVLAASTGFAFIAMLMHSCHALLQFRKLYGNCPCYFVGDCKASKS